MKTTVAATLAFVCVALASPSLLAAPANDAAEARFNEALELAKAGRYAEACPKLEESQRLDPALGTQFNLADCYERTDRLARAWRLFREVADGARQVGKAERAKAAQDRAQALERRMPRLRIRVGSDGTTVDRDGERVPVAELGQAVPVDPGNHTVEAHSGDKSWRTEVSVVEAAKTVDVEIPNLTAAAPPSPVVPPPPPAPTPAPIAEPAPEKPIEPRSRPLRTVGLIAGGVGLVGLGVGTFFALRASSKNDDSNADGHCDATGCDAQGKAARNDALDAATVSTITVIAGSALLAGGVALFLFAPMSGGSGARHRTTEVAVGPGNLLLRGRW